jgi:hypothetical protein
MIYDLRFTIELEKKDARIACSVLRDFRTNALGKFPSAIGNRPSTIFS